MLDKADHTHLLSARKTILSYRIVSMYVRCIINDVLHSASFL